MLNLAIYDAVAVATNGSEAETFYDYDIKLRRNAGISAEVAASQAAHTVLSSLYPDQQDRLDAFLETSLSSVRTDGSFRESLEVGTEIGNEILAIRANDGSDVTSEYTYTDEAGYYQADPLNPDVPAWGPHWGDVDTFAISSSDDFRPESTPALTSEEYAASYKEVLELGALDSETRTAEQTEIGLFWAYDVKGLGTPIELYNDILQTVAIQQGNTLEENAALFAQASVAMADSAITAWDTKFTEEFYGTDDIAFDFTSAELELLLDDPELQEAYGLDLDDATRSFDSFSEAMIENGRSRIYLGVHFDFDDLIGQEVGQAIAADVASEFEVASDDGSGDMGDELKAREPDTFAGQRRNIQQASDTDEPSRRAARENRFAAVAAVFAQLF
jgi:hypothetical protein